MEENVGKVHLIDSIETLQVMCRGTPPALPDGILSSDQAFVKTCYELHNQNRRPIICDIAYFLW